VRQGWITHLQARIALGLRTALDCTAKYDEVLEENAEEFVRSYVQKGGE
jgi:ubiquitin-like protein Pup